MKSSTHTENRDASEAINIQRPGRSNSFSGSTPEGHILFLYPVLVRRADVYVVFIF